MKKSIYTLLVLLFVASCQKTVDLDNDKEEFINDLISKMTLAEKAGQMNQYNGFGMQLAQCLKETIKRKDIMN